MYKKLLYFFCLTLLSNCATSGAAFLGPAFTGARTGSVYQSSLSFSSTKVINHLKSNEIVINFPKKFNHQNESHAIKKNEFFDQDSTVTLAYKIDKIEFSDVLEPEPLP